MTTDRSLTAPCGDNARRHARPTRTSVRAEVAWAARTTARSNVQQRGFKAAFGRYSSR